MFLLRCRLAVSSAASDDLPNLLTRYRQLCADLGDLYVERAEALAAEVTTRAAAYASLAAQGGNVTACREGADAAVAHLKSESVTLTGEIDANLTMLRWLDVAIAASRDLTHRNSDSD